LFSLVEVVSDTELELPVVKIVVKAVVNVVVNLSSPSSTLPLTSWIVYPVCALY
jgi:hypothetical protein